MFSDGVSQVPCCILPLLAQSWHFFLGEIVCSRDSCFFGSCCSSLWVPQGHGWNMSEAIPDMELHAWVSSMDSTGELVVGLGGVSGEASLGIL